MKRLHLDYLDLYFCHRPDPDTPIEETVRAMHTLVMQGKICYWGTSEWSVSELQEAYRVARELNLTPPSMEQPEYNMFARHKMEDEFLPLFENEGLGTTIWSPLSSGLLTGKYMDGMPDDTRTSLESYKFIKENFESEGFQKKHEKVRELDALSKEIEIPLVNMALCWCLKNKNVSTVILGASKEDQLLQNIDSLKYSDQFDDSVMEKIDTILKK